MADRDRDSRDVVFGFFDVMTACANVANADPQEALDRFNAAVNNFTTHGGRLTGHLSAVDANVVLERAAALATYATYRYAKLVGTVAELKGVPTIDLVRKDLEPVMLGILEDDPERR